MLLSASRASAEPALRLPAFVRDLHHRIGTDALLAPLSAGSHRPVAAEEYAFWEGALSGTRYQGRPFPRPQVPAHLLAVYERWQLLLSATLHAHLPRTQAAEALAHASNVAVLLQHLSLSRPTPPAPRRRYPAPQRWI